jgi:hypothetical protein
MLTRNIILPNMHYAEHNGDMLAYFDDTREFVLNVGNNEIFMDASKAKWVADTIDSVVRGEENV